MNIYDNTKLYDVLFSNTCKQEIAFLQTLFDGRDVPVRSVFEPACGTGRLLWRLAKQGYDVVGLDLNKNAVDYSNRRFRRHGFAPAAFIGDITGFTLTDLQRTQKFDAAFNLVSSFLHLTGEEQALKHLHCVADVLETDGLYVLGLHLKPKGRQPACASEAWYAKHGTLEVCSRLEPIHCSKSKRIETIKFTLKAATPSKKWTVTDTFPLRTYTAEQFQQLLQNAGCFRVEAVYSFEYDIDNPLTIDDKTEDAVFVLAKSAS